MRVAWQQELIHEEPHASQLTNQAQYDFKHPWNTACCLLQSGMVMIYALTRLVQSGRLNQFGLPPGCPAKVQYMMEQVPALELHNLGPEPVQEWQRLLRFVGLQQDDRQVMAAAVEVSLQRAPELAISTYGYLLSAPETAVILRRPQLCGKHHNMGNEGVSNSQGHRCYHQSPTTLGCQCS